MVITDSFYQAITPIYSINDVINLEHYHDAPEDWLIALTDIRGSTKAIQAGKYKDVNAIAAASITALLNLVPEIDLPFVFGGDGATILIPPQIVKQAGEAMLATQQMALEQFGLNLRVGIVPIRDVLADGYAVRIARLHMSDNFQQAIFMGGGLAHADRLLKDPQRGQQYAVQDTGTQEADFSGFECRWNKIMSPSEETTSIIISAVAGDAEQQRRIYQDALDQIHAIYGDFNTRHPITMQHLKLAMNPYKLYVEARVRYRDASLMQLLKMLRGSIMASIAMRFNIQNWGEYRNFVVTATDHEKFDDTLRMIISGTVAQRQELRTYLEAQYQQKQLVFGIHASRYALMTCIVFNYFGRQVHFIDGDDGGYALAAKEMKAQLAALQSE